MALPGARNQYLKTQIETASKEQLVVMLFDGVIRFSEQARKAIENKQIEDSHNALMRAQAIVMELICTIDKDKGGEVASNLMGLHAYAFNCLVQCNMHKDLSKIDEVQKIYRELREGWMGAMESLGLVAGAGKPVDPAAKPAAALGQAAGKPPVAKPIPKAPISAALPKTIPAPQAKPPATSGGQDILAAAPAAVRPAPAPVASVPKAAPVAARAAAGYGMGKTAMLGGLAGVRPAVAPPSPVTPATPSAAQIQAKPVIAPINPKQAAMLSAYQAGSRSIA